MIGPATLGTALEPVRIVGDWLTFPPGDVLPGLVLLGGFFVACELARFLLSTELTRSRIAHVLVCLLTFAIQSLVLGAVLVAAAIAHPDRAWVNLLWAVCLYVVWWLAGWTARLVREDLDGPDVGFMSVGALFTFVPGLVVAVVA